MRPSRSRRGCGRHRRARQTARPARPNNPAGRREARRSFAQGFGRLHRAPEHRARGSSRCRPGIAVAFEDGAERGRHGHPPLGIDLVGEGGDKAIHPLRSSLAATLRHRQDPDHPPGCPGITWDLMGVNGPRGHNCGKFRHGVVGTPQGVMGVRRCGRQAAAAERSSRSPPGATWPSLGPRRARRVLARREWRSCRAASATGRRRRNGASRTVGSCPGWDGHRSGNVPAPPRRALARSWQGYDELGLAHFEPIEMDRKPLRRQHSYHFRQRQPDDIGVGAN